MIRKIIGCVITIIGFLTFGWGLWVFGASIYYGLAKTPGMGAAAGLGFYYGLAFIGIGLIPFIIGILIIKDPQLFFGGMILSKKHILIIWATIILTAIFFGLDSKVYVMKEDDKTCQTYQAATIYGYPIGGQIGTYEKLSPSDDYTPRRLLTKSEKGLSGVRLIAPYKYILVITTLVIGFFAFMIAKDRNKGD